MSVDEFEQHYKAVIYGVRIAAEKAISAIEDRDQANKAIVNGLGFIQDRIEEFRAAALAEFEQARERIRAVALAKLEQARERTESFDALENEMARGRAKFPSNRRLLAALMEEVGELAKALLQRDPNWRTEALQCACVAMRIYEEGDRDFDDVTDEEAQP